MRHYIEEYNSVFILNLLQDPKAIANTHVEILRLIQDEVEFGKQYRLTHFLPLNQISLQYI